MNHIKILSAIIVILIAMCATKKIQAQIPQAGWPVALGSGMEGGVMSSANYTDLDLDGDLEIVVGGLDGYIYAWHHDGTLVDRWPFQTGSYVRSSPAIGDINNDGLPEVVITSNDGYLYVLSNVGTPISGWPIEIDNNYPHNGGAHSQGSPVLADVDGDSFLDIICNSLMSRAIHIFNYQGQYIQGWPQYYSGTEHSQRTPAVADLDGDGSVEIIAGVFYATTPPNYNKIYVWHADGSSATGWPIILEDQYLSWFYPPVIADIDEDGSLDIIIADLSKIYALDHSGNMLAGWPFDLNPDYAGHNYALGNFDDDICPEVVVSSGRTGPIYILDGNGTIINTIFMAHPSRLAIADIDRDNVNEIISGSGYPDDSIYAWNDDGTLVDGFPLPTNARMISAPLILDIDGDGDVEIGLGEFDLGIDVLNFYVWDLEASYNPMMVDWPMFQGDSHNSGLYNSQQPTSIRDESQSTQLSESTELHQNYPNPFNPSTTIRYSLPQAGHVLLEIYNPSGQIVKTLVNARQSAGEYDVYWEAHDVSSGLYISRFSVDDKPINSRKMILLE